MASHETKTRRSSRTLLETPAPASAASSAPPRLEATASQSGAARGSAAFAVHGWYLDDLLSAVLSEWIAPE